MPTNIELYSFIVEIMKFNCNHETCQKLDRLKREIEKGFFSPSTNSIDIFGVNLFLYDRDEYLKMYDYVQGSLA